MVCITRSPEKLVVCAAVADSDDDVVYTEPAQLGERTVHLHDVGDAEERAAFFRQYSVRGTVMVVGVNEPLVPMVNNMLCSWRAFDTGTSFPSLIVWAMHENALQPITQLRDRLGGNFGIYSTEQYNITAADDVLALGSENYYRAMKERGIVWLRLLQTGLNLLFADADFVFFRDPIAEVTSKGGYGHVRRLEDWPAEIDVVVSTDGRDFEEGPILRRGSGQWVGWAVDLCAGFWWMRSNARTISLMNKMIQLMAENDYLNDQHVLNMALEDRAGWVVAEPPFLPSKPENDETGEANRADGIALRVLDQVRYVSGWVYMRHRQKYEEQLQRGTLTHRRQSAVHMNYWDWDKTEVLKQVGLWFVDDNGTCVPHE